MHGFLRAGEDTGRSRLNSCMPILYSQCGSVLIHNRSHTHPIRRQECCGLARRPIHFNNMLYSVILAIVGVVAITAIYFVALASFAGLGFLGGVPSRTGVTTGFFAIIGTLILGLVVLWVFILTSAIFLKKTYDAMAVKMRVDMFRTTGLLFLIGAATLVVGIGFIIVFIAAILQIVAFFSIPEQLQPSMPSQQAWGPPAPPPPMAPSQAPTQ